VTDFIKQRWIAVAAAAVLVLAVIAYFVVRDDGDKKPAKSVAVVPQLDTGGLALASLLKSGRTVTYHATYTSKSDAKVSGGTVALEMWNTKGKSRVDTTLTTPDRKVVHTASILADGKGVACRQPPGEKWSCASVPPPAEGDPAGLVESIRGKLAGRSVTQRSEKVNGDDARCFRVSAVAGAEALDVCVDRRGVILRLVSDEARIEIAKLDTSVPGSVFDPPASPGK
jgi:hypothetical protein